VAWIQTAHSLRKQYTHHKHSSPAVSASFWLITQQFTILQWWAFTWDKFWLCELWTARDLEGSSLPYRNRVISWKQECELLKFPQGCCWGYRASGVWYCLRGRVLPDVSKDFTDYTFTGQAVQKEFLICLTMLPCTLF